MVQSAYVELLSELSSHSFQVRGDSQEVEGHLCLSNSMNCKTDVTESSVGFRPEHRTPWEPSMKRQQHNKQTKPKPNQQQQKPRSQWGVGVGGGGGFLCGVAGGFLPEFLWQVCTGSPRASRCPLTFDLGEL